MQGIPGSGKSTVADMLANEEERKGYDAVVRSTDEFWYRENSNVYDYDPERRAEAHRWNQQRVVGDMHRSVSVIIVDNTNIERWQAQPYITLADIFDYEVKVVRVEVPISVAVERQADRPEDRQVPAEVILDMHERMETLL